MFPLSLISVLLESSSSTIQGLSFDQIGLTKSEKSDDEDDDNNDDDNNLFGEHFNISHVL